MSYRTILVYLDNKQHAPALLSVASRLAEQHSAHLLGLYVAPSLEVCVTTEVPIPAELSKNHLLYHDNLSDALQKEFESVTDGRDFSAEWRKLVPQALTVSDSIAELAHTVDLVVIGQKNAASGNITQRELPERVLLSACRPVIVVPVIDARFKTIARRVFAAWNGSGEATRAVFDALPILREADTVMLHTINPSYYERHRLPGTAAELVNSLSRHGVNISFSESDSRGGELADDLLSYAMDCAADMIVMGGYGHSRLRESLFGGVSRRVLVEMKVPVLMSH